MESQIAQLNEWLDRKEKIAIAFSGGVDSTLLAGAARRRLGRDKVRLFLMDSLLLPRREYLMAQRLALFMDAPLEVLSFEPLALPEVCANSSMRCYHCKKHLMAELIAAASRSGFSSIADGANWDDLGDFRPGMQACDELGILHPFIEGKWSKADIRALAREWKLPNWDWPAAACLASRIPCGTRLEAPTLAKIERAEAFLSDQGFVGARVRAVDGRAQVELRSDEDFVRAIEKRGLLDEQLRKIGFKPVVLDLAGYSTGSMNDPSLCRHSPNDLLER